MKIIESSLPHARNLANIDRIKLKNGHTRYNLLRSTNKESPVALLIHGIASYSFVWKHLSESLHESGFNVLSLDLYGRGFSDSPITRYDQHLFIGQIEELLQELGLFDHQLILVGHSMGGAIATAFAAKYPDKISKLILLAPAGVPTSPVSRAIIRVATAIPVLSDALFFFVVRYLIEKLPHKPFHNPHLHAENIKISHSNHLIMLEANPGFLRSYLATVRHFPLTDLKNDYLTVEKNKIPTLLIWGLNDRLIPYHNVHRIKQYIPSIKVHTLEDTGHQLVLERQSEVAETIAKFVK